jgi:hypothetical protein
MTSLKNYQNLVKKFGIAKVPMFYLQIGLPDIEMH